MLKEISAPALKKIGENIAANLGKIETADGGQVISKVANIYKTAIPQQPGGNNYDYQYYFDLGKQDAKAGMLPNISLSEWKSEARAGYLGGYNQEQERQEMLHAKNQTKTTILNALNPIVLIGMFGLGFWSGWKIRNSIK